MKLIAVEKAQRRLEEARKALLALDRAGTSPTLDVFREEWGRFLTAINSVHEIILTSAKKSPSDQNWYYSGPHKTIKSDPLLSYLKAARGVDYHGDVDTASLTSKILGEAHVSETPFRSVAFTMVDEQGNESTRSPERVWVAGPFTPRLQSVQDNHGNCFDVPDKHLGSDISGLSIYQTANLALVFYEGMIAEAKARK